MKRFFYTIIGLFATILTMSAQTDTTHINLDEIVVSSFYSTSLTVNNVIDVDNLVENNYGQEPSNYFTKMPSIISLNDNGTEFGYGYFRIRGLDQTRINVTLDGCPWNEAEDYGSYFANSPDLMLSMHSIKVEKGTSSRTLSARDRGRIDEIIKALKFLEKDKMICYADEIYFLKRIREW